MDKFPETLFQTLGHNKLTGHKPRRCKNLPKRQKPVVATTCFGPTIKTHLAILQLVKRMVQVLACYLYFSLTLTLYTHVILNHCRIIYFLTCSILCHKGKVASLCLSPFLYWQPLWTTLQLVLPQPLLAPFWLAVCSPHCCW